ncbi:large neutral amino acids transporter small subunit 3-like [Echeneis naucrates]|uniref:large neutral amino acids transporter small subunit 3-like n=1 Tax=Echeneis naucrates TaxID=173247 RepID=UPI001113FF67|nr:large neutral amino acids transporter small subunit 3-like [Echeneis naucrates]
MVGTVRKNKPELPPALLTGTYTCKPMTARWHVALFHNILDVSAFNAYVVWTAIDPTWNQGKSFKRRLFIAELGKALSLSLSSLLVPICHSVCSSILMWSLITMTMTQLRLIFFLGAMNKMLEFLITHGNPNPSEELQKEVKEQVPFYSPIFGTMQQLCPLTCPLIGYIMDWGIKECEEETKEGQNIQKLTNAMRAFIFTNLLLVTFGIVSLIDNLPIQVRKILHRNLSGFITSCCFSLYSRCPANHFGTLTGMQSMINAAFDLLQQQLFILMVGHFHGDPYCINLGLLIFSLTGFLLPGYLFYHRKNLIRARAAHGRLAAGKTQNKSIS